MKVASAQFVETSQSVTNNSSFENYPHPDDHAIRITSTVYSVTSIFHEKHH